MAIQITEPDIAVGDVYGNCHVQAACLLVNWVEVRVYEQAASLDGAPPHGASAIFFGEANLVQRVRYAQCRRHAGPAQTTLCLPPNVRQPAVPTFTQRDLDGRPIRS